MNTTPDERIVSSPDRYQMIFEAIFGRAIGVPVRNMDALQVHLADLIKIAKSVGYDFALKQYELNGGYLNSDHNPFYDEEKSD